MGNTCSLYCSEATIQLCLYILYIFTPHGNFTLHLFHYQMCAPHQPRTRTRTRCRSVLCCKRQSLQATWAKVTNCFNSTKGNCTRTATTITMGVQTERWKWVWGTLKGLGAENGNVPCNPFLAFALDNFLLRFAAVSLAAVSFLSFVHDISAFLISPGTTKGISRMMTAICGWSWHRQQLSPALSPLLRNYLNFLAMPTVPLSIVVPLTVLCDSLCTVANWKCSSRHAPSANDANWNGKIGNIAVENVICNCTLVNNLG